MRGLLKPLREMDPWWEMVLIRSDPSEGGGGGGPVVGGGRGVILLRVHHTLADGIALVGLLQALVTHADGTPVTLDFLQQPRKASIGLWGYAQRGVAILKAAGTCLTLGLTK